ncbi:MAG: efflux RND transporter periplasmic adaptor subunit [Thermoguttaceae bacterium]
MDSESVATLSHAEDTSGVRLDVPHAAAWEARTTAAILDLVQKTSRAEDLPAACRMLANELQQFLGCGQVAVGLRRRGRGRCRIAAVSGLADLDLRSETSRRLEATMDEAVLHAAQAHRLPSGADDVTRACDAADVRSDSTLPDRSISIPLRSNDQMIVGAWTCIGSPEVIASERNLRFLEVAASSVAGTLQLLEKAEGGPVRRTVRRIARAVPKARGPAIVAAAVVVAAGLCIPVPYDVGMQCELQPDVRRFVAAPHAGDFQKSLVKPGDIVAKGQVLARMDGRELRWELAGVAAEQEHAHKSRDVNMAAGKTAAAQIDQLEIQRQEVKRQLLERRLANLELKSPVDGIVVAGDLQRSEGVPVNVGQVLYEVAPLGQMTAESAITDEEISGVSSGMPVTLRLDSHPERRWRGTLARIHPRSVTREKDNVFLGEIPLNNADGVLRPGMKGRATVRTGSRSLGWVLFHRPWNYLMTWLDW